MYVESLLFVVLSCHSEPFAVFIKLFLPLILSLSKNHPVEDPNFSLLALNLIPPLSLSLSKKVRQLRTNSAWQSHYVPPPHRDSSVASLAQNDSIRPPRSPRHY